MGLSIWVRSFLNPYFPSPDVLLTRHRRSSIAEKWLSLSELSDSSTTDPWVSDGPASWQMVLILPGFPAGEHSLFRISLWVTHHTDSGSCPSLSAQHKHFDGTIILTVEKGLESKEQWLQQHCNCPILSWAASATTPTGVLAAGGGARLNEVTVACFSTWEWDLPNSFKKETHMVSWVWSHHLILK